MYLKYFVIFLGVHLATVTSKHVKFYRKDYTYVFDYDAFYKLHVDNNTSWNTAFLSCENEDAKLFYPSEADEWRIVNKLREEMAETANVTDVLIGVHNKFNVGEFLTVDGDTPPIPMGDDLSRVEEGEACVTMDADRGSYEKGPCTRQSPTLFICKKMDNQPCQTTTCPTIDPDYKYSPQTKKCYKVNKSPKQWQDAMQTCYMEGGLLAVAEDTTRVDYIRNVIELEQYKTYFIGIRDLFNNGKYYTVEGKNIGEILHRADQTVSEYSSYNNHRWQSGQRRTGHNSHETGLDFSTPTPSGQFGCGVLTYQTIEADTCYKERPFVCEMDARNSSPIPLGAALQHVDEGEACVTMSIYGGSYQKTLCTSTSPTLFVCKKLDNKPCPTTICPTIDPDYKYSKKLNKCYKVNKNALRWQEAMQICFVEGALLAVTEDMARADIISNVLALNHSMTYFVGVLDLFKNGNYYTVKGEKFGAYALPVKNESDSQHNSERDDVTPTYDDTTFVYHGDFDYNGEEGYGFSTTSNTIETVRNVNLSGSKGDKQVTERIDFANVPRTLGCGALSGNKLKASSCYEEMSFICEMEINKQL